MAKAFVVALIVFKYFLTSFSRRVLPNDPVQSHSPTTETSLPSSLASFDGTLVKIVVRIL